ncbi:MAG: aspartate aminotransferase family protein [Chloroflexota bacterium]|nr:aspartate aminotransferase family protein [Chloroflexota bacterium]
MTVLIHDSIQTIEDRHASGAYSKRPIALVRGQGCTVWDSDGSAYLDATSGQGVALLGHCHPDVTAAIVAQAGTLVTCSEAFYNDRRAELVALLASLLPAGLDRIFLCNSGAEATEGALKVARLLTGRDRIVAARRGFHGRTMGALGLTWNKEYREPFAGWTLPTVTHVSYNDLESARAAIDSTIAAVVIEPIQGEGGVHPADADYLRGLRALCDAHGVLLVLDEIQTGWGRTGAWFGFQIAPEIVPDMLVLAKGIAGGVPMGAVAWRGALGTLPAGSHGSTFGGNPLACAAAVAALTAIRDADLPTRSRDLGARLIADLGGRDLPGVRELRGRGLMIGIELRDRVQPVLAALAARGVLALPAGKTVLRLLPPLILSDHEAAQLADAVEGALHDVASH